MPERWQTKMVCAFCEEPIHLNELRTDGTNFVAHQECSLRDVIGGIGHLIDHEHFCQDREDPDAGLPRRLSSLMVAAWVKYHGVGNYAELYANTERGERQEP